MALLFHFFENFFKNQISFSLYKTPYNFMYKVLSIRKLSGGTNIYLVYTTWCVS